jgi:glucose-6-phosphate 1-dehydrogenase
VVARFLPTNLRIFGYARSEMSADALHARIKGYLKGDSGSIDDFLKLITYIHGAGLRDWLLRLVAPPLFSGEGTCRCWR